MANTNLDMFKEVFDLFAVDGCIGDPYGNNAYAYLRVSTDQQAEEGRSGLPRQIESVHKATQQERLRIPWDMVFADDESGFTLERPELQALLQETNSPRRRRANFIVCEHLDRLSRHADWHQGWLIDQFENVRGMWLVFYKSFSSRIERAVMGAVSQDGMERSQEIMRQGKIIKAREGKVTAGSRSAYGYIRVDFDGNVSSKTRRESQYKPVEPEAGTMRFIYDQIISGRTLRQIALELNETIGLPRSAMKWDASYIYQLISNPVYKGKFCANRYGSHKVQKTDKKTGKQVTRVNRYEKPESEWILVDVPPIVSEETWELANAIVKKNKVTARRNAKHPYLLTGLLACANCGYAWIGFPNRPNSNADNILYYGCSVRRYKGNSERKYMTLDCTAPYVRAKIIEDAVWSVVQDVVLHPTVLLEYLDEQFTSSENQALFQQIEYLKTQVQRKKKSDDNDLLLLDLGTYTPQEYHERHLAYKEARQALEEEIAKLEKRVLTPEKVDEQKQLIMDIADATRQYQDMGNDTPFEVKKHIIKMYVRLITVDSHSQQLIIEGQVGTWQTPFDMRDMRGYKNSGNGGENGDIELGQYGSIQPSRR